MQADDKSKTYMTYDLDGGIGYPDFQHIMQEFLSMQHLYSAGIKEVKTKLEILDEEFRMKYDRNPIHHIEHRLKSPRSIIGKMQRKGIEITVENVKTHLYDIAGIRVICSYIDDIYKVAGFLSSQDDIETVRVRDYIKNPKPNGYRSLHLVVKIPIFLSGGKEYVHVEVQIRTIAMDFWASLEHQMKYKSDVKDSPELRKKLLECAQAINDVDVKMFEIYKELFENDDLQPDLPTKSSFV